MSGPMVCTPHVCLHACVRHILQRTPVSRNSPLLLQVMCTCTQRLLSFFSWPLKKHPKSNTWVSPPTRMASRFCQVLPGNSRKAMGSYPAEDVTRESF